MRKLTKVSRSCFIISESRFTFLAYLKSPEMNFFAMDSNPSAQSAIMYSDAFVSGWIIFAQSLIAFVLLNGTYSQILIHVVQWVTISVIPLAGIIGVKAKQFAMQPDDALFIKANGNIANCVKLLGFAIPFRIVLAMCKLKKPMRRNPRNLSLREWNLDVICSGHPQTSLSRESGLFQQPMPLVYLFRGVQWQN